MKLRVSEADILLGEIPYGLARVWRGAQARPSYKKQMFKRKRSYYRALIRGEPWALEYAVEHRRLAEIAKEWYEFTLSNEEPNSRTSIPTQVEIKTKADE
jgi:hypothetical protein